MAFVSEIPTETIERIQSLEEIPNKIRFLVEASPNMESKISTLKKFYPQVEIDTTQSNNFIVTDKDGNSLFVVRGDGTYTHAGSETSDRDLKENILEVSGTSLDKICKLPIKSFKMKPTGDDLSWKSHQKTGFIAQEVQEVLPDVVTGTDGQKNERRNF